MEGKGVGARRGQPTKWERAALLTSPSTPRPDAAFSLLLGLRNAWCYLLYLSIRSRAPKWTQVLKGRHVGLPLRRHLVRLSLFLCPPHPILCLSPRGPRNLGRTRLRDSFLHVGQMSPLQIPLGTCSGQGTQRWLSVVTSASHVTLLGPQRLLLAQPYPMEFVRGAA